MDLSKRVSLMLKIYDTAHIAGIVQQEGLYKEAKNAMIKKMFGETEEQQLAYLRLRMPITLAVCGVGAVVWPGIIVFAAYYWGWQFIKGWLGVTTFLTLLSFRGNIAVGVIIVVFFVSIGYLIGLVCSLIAFMRWLQLLIRCKRSNVEV